MRLRTSFAARLAVIRVVTTVTGAVAVPAMSAAAPPLPDPPAGHAVPAVPAVPIAPAVPGAPSGAPAAREVVGLRTETSRTLELPGVGFRTELYTAPIHRRDGAGAWQPITAGNAAIDPIGSDKITDCHIVDGGYANTSFCGADVLELGFAPSTQGNVHRRILMKFDVSAIPRAAVVLDADLRLTATNADRGTLDFPVQAFRLAQDWTTGATWNNSGTGAWSGGLWGPTLLDSRRLTATLGDWHIYPTRQVQNWVDRSSANAGLILKQQNESTLLGRMQFASSSNADVAKRPVMSVDWRVQGGQKQVNTILTQSSTDRCDLGPNVGTGTLLARCTEFRIDGVGQELALSRYYSSTDPYGGLNNADGTLGLNRWRLSTGVYLLWRPNQLLFVDGSGAVHPFHRYGTAELRTPPGLDAALEENQPAAGQYRLKFHQSGTQYIFKKFNTEFFNWTYQLWKIVDRNQNTVEFNYTTRAGFAEGAFDWVKDTRGRTITAGWTRDQASGRDFLTSLADSAGRTVHYTYTGQQLTRVTDTNAKVTDYQYADVGANRQQLTKIVDPNRNEIGLGYDTTGRVVDINRHRTATTTDNTHLTYNDSVNPPTTTVRDPRGNSTVYQIQHRDFAGRVTKVIDAKGKERSTSYTSNAKVGSRTNQVGGVTTNTWGANPTISGDATSGASLTRTVGPMGATTRFDYTAGGSACPAGVPSSGNGYQPLCAQNSLGNTSFYTYDGPGNLNRSTDQGGAAARVDRAVAGSGTSPTDGRVLRSTDPRGFVTTYNYVDVTFGGRTTKRLASITAPGGSGLGTRTLTYDGLDRLKTFTSGRSTVATLSYDGADRVTRVDYNDATVDVSYAYDDNGNLKQRTDATGTTTYTYNGKNQLTRIVNAQGTLAYDYDGAGNLLSATDDGVTTSYGYDILNQVVTMTEPGGRLTRFAYRADGKRTDTWYSANSSDPPTSWAAHTRVEFDLAARLTRIKTTRAGSDADANRVADVTHCYGAFVNLTTPCATAPNASADRSKVTWAKDNLTGKVTFYGYDTGNRLHTAWPHDGTNAYTYRYDKAGNREVLERSGGVATVHYEYNAANQLCWTGPAAGGACTSPPAGSDTRYRYDAAGNQVESPELAALVYNGSEQTTATTARGGATTSYAYAGDNQVERTTVGGTTLRNGLLGVQSQLTAGKRTSFGRTPDGGLVTVRTPGGEFFAVYDAQGSVVALVDPAGTHRAGYTYGPYGEAATATAHNGSLPENPYRFKGEYLDGATGNYKIGMRYYQPGTGRWTQQDSIEVLGDPGRGNRYVYAGSDPLNNVDPTGLISWSSVVSVGKTVIGTAAKVAGVVCYTYEAATDEEDDLGDEFGDLSNCFNPVDNITDDLGWTDTNE